MRGMSRLNRAVLSFGLILAMAGSVWAVDYYVHGNFPSPSSPATSASMRAELDLISSGFARLPALTGNANKVVIVNGGATGLTTTTGQLALGGNFTVTGAFNTTLVQAASITLNLPGVSGTLATVDGTETFTTKTFNLTSNTLSGTTAQFNAALSDNDFATLAGSETLTTKTINLTSNTLSGTTAQFNTALSDNDFATLAGSETLTNKTIITPSGLVKGDVGLGNVDNTSDATKNAASVTLTNKTISSPVLSGTVTGTYTLGGTTTIPGSLTAGSILELNPFALNSTTTQAHGLGVVPAVTVMTLVCLTAELGYSINDTIDVQASQYGAGSGGTILSIIKDATNIDLIVSNSGLTIAVNHKSTRAISTITAANWKLVVTPYRIN